jgi:hypothetical protein
MGGIYEISHWDGLRCHDVRTKFHKDCFRHSEVDRRDTQTQCWSHKHSFIQQWLYSLLLGPGLFFSSVTFIYTGGRTSWTGDQPVARPLPTQDNANTEEMHTQTSMPWVRFEPTIPAFERAKTVHVLDRAATVIGWFHFFKQRMAWD